MSEESYRQLLLKTLSPVERKVVEKQFDQAPLARRRYVSRHLDRMVQELEDNQFLWPHQKKMLIAARPICR